MRRLIIGLAAVAAFALPSSALAGGEWGRCSQYGAEHRDHVTDLRHHRGALFDQLVAALRARIER